MEEIKLSKSEQARKEKFDALCAKLEQEGYRKHDLSIDVKKANIYGVVTPLPLALIIAGIYWAVNRGFHGFEVFWDLYIALALFFALVVVHELIHGVTWAIFAKNKFKSISFGVIWKALTPYCTCSDPLRKGQYILGGIMPTVILGIGLGIVSTVMGSVFLFIVAEFMIFGGGGDILMIMKMLKFKPKGNDVVFCDHPYEVGMVAFEK